ncbi:LysR family transcriptional regulator [Ramlibacter solisilvae]
MRVFEQVVTERGFAAAARKLELAPAVVTRLVGDLEKHLGVRLLNRTTRQISLTPAGEAYLGRLRDILSDIDEADALAHAHTLEMTGVVRVLALPTLATHLVAPAIAGFQRQFPKVQIELHAVDTPRPNLQDYDLALLSDIDHLDGSAVVRRIRDTSAIICASPDYLRRHGEPSSPSELANHRWLRRRLAGKRMQAVMLIDPSGREGPVKVDVPAAFVANHQDTLLRATVDGAGISSQSMHVVAPLLKSGQLTRVLRPWITERFSVVAALPSRKFMPARTRAFLEHIIEQARRAAAGVDEDAAFDSPPPLRKTRP